MRNYFRLPKILTQHFDELEIFFHDAAAALDISDGEFWIWYGSPFILYRTSYK